MDEGPVTALLRHQPSHVSVPAQSQKYGDACAVCTVGRVAPPFAIYFLELPGIELSYQR